MRRLVALFLFGGSLALFAQGVSNPGGGGLASTDIDTSSEVRTIVTDETGGAGLLVFNVNPTLIGATLTGQLLNETASAASSPAKYMTGAWFTGGTGTTTFPHLLLQATGTTASTTWSTAGTGIGVNAVTGFTGNLIDLQLAGVSRFKIASNSGAATFIGDVNTSASMTIGGNVASLVHTGITGLSLRDTAGVTFSSTSSYAGSRDTGVHRNAAGVLEINSGTAGTFRDLKLRTLISDASVRLKGYTVATLPAGTQGDTAFVTDATAPTYNGALVGGGAVVIPVFYNGTAWVSH